MRSASYCSSPPIHHWPEHESSGLGQKLSVDGKAQLVEQVPFCRVSNCPTLNYISLLRELSWDAALVSLNENLQKGAMQVVLVPVVEHVCGLLVV